MATEYNHQFQFWILLMKTVIVPQIEKKTYFAGGGICGNYLTRWNCGTYRLSHWRNMCRLSHQAACGTLCPKTAERSSSRTCRSSSSSTPIIKYTHYHHVLHYLHYHHCCQGGITEYTITISAILGNAKMKGVTTKVWWMRVIFIIIFMLSFYLIICQQLSVGVSTPLSTTKSNTSPFGLDAKQ